MKDIVTVETVAGGVGLIGGLVLLFNRIGWLHFGAKKACEVPECRETVINNRQNIASLRHDINGMAEDVAEIKTDVKEITKTIGNISIDLGIIKGK